MQKIPKNVKNSVFCFTYLGGNNNAKNMKTFHFGQVYLIIWAFPPKYMSPKKGFI